MSKFTELINKISTDMRLKPDLLKAENGNNFRALSESAILDVIEPILREANIYYTTRIIDVQHEIKEAFGKKGKKLQFVVYITVALDFWQDQDFPVKGGIIKVAEQQSVGMGIDDCDKAAGKAYTYAVKSGLFKLFRLRYGDDPDFTASEPLLTSPLPADEKKSHEETKKPSKKAEKKESEPLMSEKQRSYITGMMEDKGITSQQIMGKFGGLDPVEDDNIPMKTARAMIKYLEEIEDLPF